jgi:peptidoglycan/LPS O-acetylase OafA/YrhL
MTERSEVIQKSKYRPEIDGLRALSVVAVIMFHAKFDLFSGGFVGVDVFFVISGYLITGIIASSLERGDFSFGKFFESRVRRIVPGLLGVIILALPFAWAVMMPYQLERFSLSSASAASFISNIFFWKQSGYFADAAIEMPLLHTWSLSVEGQFYLAFPVVLVLVWRLASRWVPAFLAIAFVISIGAAEWGAHNMRVANYFLAPTRAWEFLAGSLIALRPDVWKQANRGLSEFLSIFGLFLILYAVFTFDETTRMPGLIGLAPIAGACLVTAFATSQTFIGRAFSLPPIVGTGLISYSLYLWHYPILSIAHLGSAQELGVSDRLLLVMLAFPVAFLSWKFIEKPFRNRRAIQKYLLFTTSGLVMVATLAVGFIGYATKGLEQQFIQRHGEAGAAIVRALDGMENIIEDLDCSFSSGFPDSTFTERFETCADIHGTAHLIIGDSHSMDLYNAIRLNTSNPFVVGLLQHGCRPGQIGDNCSYDVVEKFVSDQANRISRVLFTQNGSTLTSWSWQTHRFEPDQQQIDHDDSLLSALAEHVDVYWLGPQIEPSVDLRKIHPQTGYMPEPNRDLITGISQTDDYLDKRINGHSTYSYISKLDAVGFEFERDFRINGEYTYSDVDHWSTFGEKVFGARLLEYLSKRGIRGL